MVADDALRKQKSSYKMGMLGKRNGTFLEKEMFDLKTNSNNKEKQEEEHSRLWKGIIQKQPRTKKRTIHSERWDNRVESKWQEIKLEESQGPHFLVNSQTPIMSTTMYQTLRIQGLRYNPHSQ